MAQTSQEATPPADPGNGAENSGGFIARMLDWIERIGNKLPDPAMLFLFALIIVWLCSWIFNGVQYIDPGSGDTRAIKSLMTGSEFARFLAGMVTTFTSFPPLGVVLVAMLGVGVAERSGYINAAIKLMLGFTPKFLLTPMLVLVAIVSHTATDAGYVLVIPLGGVIYYAAGRHPLAGIAAAFAGVSGGFSANFIPSAIDPLLQGFTQSAAQVLDAGVQVNPLCNWFFTGASSALIIVLAWFLTDKVIEPRLNKSPVDKDAEEPPKMERLSPVESKAFWISTLLMVIGLVVLLVASLPATSPMRDSQGSLASFGAPIMQSIVPLIFLLFVLPGTLYGFLAGTFRKSKDVVSKMSQTMSDMGYYMVMAFFCALFTAEFKHSNIGAFLAVEGAEFLKALNLAPQITIAGIILLAAGVNLLIGSASAKWALLAPIFVPMLMQLNISPELTQAAYRVGDSSSNIITPLMPYFPLVVVYCQRYVKKTGIGTLTSIMMPYSITFLIAWTVFLLIYWTIGIPLGLQASYTYP